MEHDKFATVAEDTLSELWEELRELSLGSAPNIDRLDSPPSPLRFLRDYVLPNKPCVISGGALHWSAISLWSQDSYLSNALRDQTVSVHLTPDGRADAIVPRPSTPSSLSSSVSSPSAVGGDCNSCFASAFVERMPFPDALRLIVSSGSPSSPFVAYAQEQNDCLRSEYSGVSADVEADIPWATEALGCLPEAVNLWVGNGRSETWFHKDHYENLYAVVSGAKRFVLLPPTEVHRVYVRRYPAARYSAFDQVTGGLRLEMEEPERWVPWCSVDPHPPPSSEKRAASSFPLYFEGPKPFECTVEAGDILYLPSMWFHHVRQSPDSATGRTIAVNYWYDMQFDIKYAYFNFLQSLRPVRTPTSHGAGGHTEDDGAEPGQP